MNEKKIKAKLDMKIMSEEKIDRMIEYHQNKINEYMGFKEVLKEDMDMMSDQLVEIETVKALAKSKVDTEEKKKEK